MPGCPDGRVELGNKGRPGQPKVVFVNRFFFPDQSATSRILSDLAFHLTRLGASVAVVTSRQLYDNPRAKLPAMEVVDGVTVHRIDTATRGRSNLAGRALDYATFYVAAGLKLLRVLDPGDVVVAKTDPPLISIPVSAAAGLKGAVAINWLQDLFPEVAAILTPGLVPGWLQKPLAWWRDRTLRRAAMNVVLGERMRNHLRARGIDDARIAVIANWSDTDSIVPLGSRSSVTRQSLGLTAELVLGYSGNFGRAHEFETLLGAAGLLREDPRFAFLMTGAGAKRAPLQRAVQEQRLNSFIFQDYQPPERLGDSLAAADVHLVSLLPALEGLIVPSKVYGILSAGRPVLFIGDIDGDIASLIREYDCGMAVAVGDSEGLASALRILHEDRERLESMGRRSRELAVSRFTGTQAALEWLNLLNQAAPALCPALEPRSVL